MSSASRYTSAMRVLLVCLLLAACSDTPSDASRAERRAKREAAAAAFIAKPPTAQEHTLDKGGLVVLDVPVTDGYGGMERQKCFVWREPGIASISCPSRETYISN